ncbi:probable inactive DNA (cytosine-5)-methyltransferase DRM3 isoform X1 [Olea europaea var. sylvestris]|uniref:probable inactive DNA (cytosine-5)-methyltransferase DRM3 isoform X1 n=1 Tax=Olea europaea var. sylvestris TaxID=158386 RepID=UPI000C1D18DA|nr:probable inactive DNA (cytosine-5)-methyltransferase DRM3 isoform X1 [Olea europaea var. sylvestris]XP_022879539.1 probable inactive DNA (cytosine-5)-methyltransferase DRM3 isoform X1 [Olea europaea var. sylvestris]XP_022879540.1 probable inactive DNA (cytosine-5)-methyltransferase DRM3 isoform X1 [Olea europaea var. sylvestris]XP_022879541.1 probable inactive DNA (cytosine-5)-methyltransferase DRM3 isoform X1 [Olea europaea var. sylvestris]
MCEIVDISDSEEESPTQQNVADIKPKLDYLDYEVPSQNMSSRDIVQDNVASSSGSNLRSSLIGMGFSPSLVDKAIEENGRDNVDLLLETLFAYPALQNPKTESFDDALFHEKDELAADFHGREALHRSASSDSLDSLFGDGGDTSSHTNIGTDDQLKEEPHVGSTIVDGKKANLLKMSFSIDEVEFAMARLGEDAFVHELVDIIIAARMAKKYEKNGNFPICGDAERNKECRNEILPGIMDKTLRLLEMGFSEQEISTSFERYGSEAPLSELAGSIVAGENAGTDTKPDKHLLNFLSNSSARKNYRSLDRGMGDRSSYQSIKPFTVKTEEYAPDTASHVGDFDVMEKFKGKRPKEEYNDVRSNLKKSKEEFDAVSSTSVGPTWLGPRNGKSMLTSRWMPDSQRHVGHSAGLLDKHGMPQRSMPNSCRVLDNVVAKPPYFFYGSITNLSQDSWVKVSQFLYSVQPEFINAQFFSALVRKEGYVHNLPIEDRFHILPKPPMTIQEALPHTGKWWPSWDARKQLSCISSETKENSQLCDRLGRMVINSKGILTVEQQKDLLHQCQTLNLVWVGRHKLAPLEPEHLERIMGYPVRHTQVAGFSMAERLESLKQSFQTDTLAYHLSVLRSLFPEGLTLLSIYCGIGGVEIALNRIGIRLKGVVSVEPCEAKRRIVKQWWESSGQSGELVQIESIQSLSSNKLESLIKKFSGFDFVICQNPYTVANSDNLAGLDFSMFVEFVRVLQRVRTTIERRG